MALTYTDRRRFFLATTLTLLALPALWWVNQTENSTAPNVAVAGAGVGVDVGAGHDTSSERPPDAATTALAAAEDTVATETTETTAATAAPAAIPARAAAMADHEAIGQIAPVFLDGPSGEVGAGLAEIAVPAPPVVARIRAAATFRSNIGRDSCVVPGVVNGRTVTIVNLDTGRSVTCTTAVAQGRATDQITLDTRLFAELADLTDAPIPVEIRQ